jgi:flagellar protein FliT
VRTHLLEYYQDLCDASEHMLKAARSGDWDQVARIEESARTLIAELQRAARERNLSRTEDRERMRIMYRIVVADAEIRHLAQPWLERLDGILTGRPPGRPAGPH